MRLETKTISNTIVGLQHDTIILGHAGLSQRQTTNPTNVIHFCRIGYSEDPNASFFLLTTRDSIICCSNAVPIHFDL
jgi:hypothetical protein